MLWSIKFLFSLNTFLSLWSVNCSPSACIFSTTETDYSKCGHMFQHLKTDSFLASSRQTKGETRPHVSIYLCELEIHQELELKGVGVYIMPARQHLPLRLWQCIWKFTLYVTTLKGCHPLSSLDQTKCHFLPCQVIIVTYWGIMWMLKNSWNANCHMCFFVFSSFFNKCSGGCFDGKRISCKLQQSY